MKWGHCTRHLERDKEIARSLQSFPIFEGVLGRVSKYNKVMLERWKNNFKVLF